MSMLRPLMKMFAIWMVAGSGSLAVVSYLTSEPVKPVIAAPEPLPCKQQAWPMIDRECLSWTAPPKPVVRAEAELPTEAGSQNEPDIRNEPERVAAAIEEDPEQAGEVDAPAAPVIRAEPVAPRPAVAAEPTPVAAPRPQRPAVARSASPNEIHVLARSANGRPRTIVIRPTSPQDVLYYSARRDVAAFGPQALPR